ncbi:MAG: heme ABC exporter ATP-binding protein CcmA [Planctomycetota bacterium]|jgi:heme ABC exporter ATP-binding subunit CcmA
MSRSATNNGPAVRIESVSKAFGPRPVLKNIDLEVPAGQGLCICGANGAGKSTLLRTVAGLLRPTHGSVKLYGFDVHSQSEDAKSEMGVISHKSMSYPELTVFENLRFFARLYGLTDHRNRVSELLEDLGLSSYRHERAAILSRGMLQRLAIARAMLHRPRILLADEPFTGLDARAGRHLIDVLTGFRADGGTLIMTSHDTTQALRCCDRAAVLDGHRIIFDELTSRIDVDLFAKDYISYVGRSS